MGRHSSGIDHTRLKSIAAEISAIHKLGVEIGIITGGGNIFRGLHSEALGVGRVAGDHMGMLATVINSIALGEALIRMGSEARIMTSIDMIKIAEPYVQQRAINHLAKNRIVLFGAGTGNPFFTTDTAAALKAMEIDAEVLLKATKVDGVYNSDPLLEPSAKPFPELTYTEVIEKDLKVMDLTAVSLAKDGGLPIIVFNLLQKGNIMKVISGEKIGTSITGEKP